MAEIIPKELPKVPGWINILFYALIVILLVSIVSFFILNNSLNKAVSHLSELESAIAQEKSPEDLALEEEVLSYKTKLQDFQFLSEEHKQNTKSFTFLEETVHPSVWFSVYELLPKESKLMLSGEAENFESLGQQLLIWKNRTELNDFRLTGANLNKNGGVDFSVLIYFKPGFLNAGD